MLTYSPLPTWLNLFHALIRRPSNHGDLAMPWCSEGDLARWLSRSAWSLALIALWRKNLACTSQITVWIPDYFCNVSLAALRRTGARLLFYPLTDKMIPDLDACKAMVNAGRPDLFVLVHYFGQPAYGATTRDFCARHGAWLIEDAAHVLYPVDGIGTYGDCVLYSPHKHLPIPDGAVLVVRKDGPARLATQLSTEKLFQNIFHSFLNVPGFSHRPACFWLLKRILQMLGVRQLRQSTTPFFPDDVATGQGIGHPRMSPLAERILNCLLDSLDTVVNIRKQNKQLWNMALNKANFRQPLIRSTNNRGIPYLADFIFNDETQAEKTYLRWQKMGLPVATWPDLPPEVASQPSCHRMAFQFRKTRLYLPLHQTIKLNQINKCISKMF